MTDCANEIKQVIESNMVRLRGDWVKKNNSYDSDACSILGFTFEACRYWDAKMGNIGIEFKKGRSIWLDLVRYSEILLREGYQEEHETFTLFFIPDKEREYIQEVYGVYTSELIKKINITDDVARSIININKMTPRSLNCQASLTVKDVREISCFIVK